MTALSSRETLSSVNTRFLNADTRQVVALVTFSRADETRLHASNETRLHASVTHTQHGEFKLQLTPKIQGNKLYLSDPTTNCIFILSPSANPEVCSVTCQTPTWHENWTSDDGLLKRLEILDPRLRVTATVIALDDTDPDTNMSQVLHHHHHQSVASLLDEEKNPPLPPRPFVPTLPKRPRDPNHPSASTIRRRHRAQQVENQRIQEQLNLRAVTYANILNHPVPQFGSMDMLVYSITADGTGVSDKPTLDLELTNVVENNAHSHWEFFVGLPFKTTLRTVQPVRVRCDDTQDIFYFQTNVGVQLFFTRSATSPTEYLTNLLIVWPDGRQFTYAVHPRTFSRLLHESSPEHHGTKPFHPAFPLDEIGQ